MVRERVTRIWRAVVRDRETGWGFAGVVGVLFLAFLIWMHAHHEMWRDETHFWALARTAQGFGDLVTGDRRYDGHPPLWYWYLRVWSWPFPEAWGMHVATVAVALVAAVLLLRYAPFPRPLKVLMLATYLFGFEYSVMCRNYVLGWMLLFLFCALYHPLRQRPLTLAVVLSLLSLSSVYGLVIAVALALFLTLDNLRVRRERPSGQVVAAALPRQLIAAAIAIVGFGFCAWSVEPVDPNPFSPAWNFAALGATRALPETLIRVLGGMVPLRPFTTDFWHLAMAYWDRIPEAMPYIGGGILAAAVAVLYRSWRLLLFYVVAVLMMAVIQQARYGGSPRHWGHYFLALVAACWLLRTLQPRRRHLPSLILLTVLCGFQAQSFVAATVVDTRELFSAGANAAAFIRRAGLQDLPLIAGPGQALTVAVYLRRPFYNMETEEVEETVAFHARRKPFSVNELLARAIAVSRERHSRVVVVTWPNALPPAPAGVTSQLIYTTPGATISDETFSIYALDAR